MILYVNGCSWSSLSNSDMTGQVYGNFLAEKLGAELINHAIPGSSNERIFRSTVRNLNELKHKDDVLCVLNLSQIYRSELWVKPDSRKSVDSRLTGNLFKNMANRYRQVNDGEYVSFLLSNPTPLDSLPLFDQYKKCAVHFGHYEKDFYDLLHRLTTTISYFKQNNIKYLIFSGINYAELLIIKELPWIATFYNEIKNDPAVLDFEKENFCMWAYKNGYKNFDSSVNLDAPWDGHPNEQAHAAWADFLYNKLKELYEI